MVAADKQFGADFLAGGGEMAARVRAFDWQSTPLGPIEAWPQSLKTAVSLILSSRHPMWIGWGPAMAFLYNDAYLHVLGWAKHPAALGRPAAEVWAEIWDICGPLADKVFTSGEASFVDDVRLFMDRGNFLEETFYSFSYSPIRDESGNVSGLFCPSTDVTPKVLNARRLRTLSQLASHALNEKTAARACEVAAGILGENPDDVPFALLYLAGDGGQFARLEQVSGRFDEGFAPAQIVDLSAGAPDHSSWPVREVFRSARREILPLGDMAGLPPGVANQRVKEAVVLPLTSQGEHKPHGVLVAGVNPCRPLDNEYLTFFELVAGQVATAIQNVRAVEEEKRRADMLAEIDRAKTVFFSNVSHEFRTPLTLMLGPLETLLANPNGLAPDTREQLALAHRNSLRLLKLVNSLLDFSRIEAGRMRASYQPSDLSVITADLASNFRSSLEAAGLEFVVDCPALPQPVVLDREMWEKIVLNLLSNAFKYTFDGRITVLLRAEDDRAVLEVSDTGTGISEEELPRIFERFHRVEGARGRSHEGTGIGLALVEELVKLHGGRITATSRPGEGSTFRVFLPFGLSHLPQDRIEEPLEAQNATASRVQAFRDEAVTWVDGAIAVSPAAGRAGTGAPQTGKAARILFADDNRDMREYVSRILDSEYELVTAVDGLEALRLLRQEDFDLLLTDVMMPHGSGFELLRAIRCDAKLHLTPVIFLSARAGEELRIEGLEAGADDYVVKPFTAQELRARVGTHVRMAMARRVAREREAALTTEAQASRDRAIQVLESITDGFLALDREWRVAYMNAAAERLNGMRREDALGKTCWELIPAAAGTIAQEQLLRVSEERLPAEFESYYEPWQRWFHVNAYPAMEGGVSVFYQDITERKQAERERAALLAREREARDEAETLNDISRALASELDLEKLVQLVTDAATILTGAKFGAFLSNVANEREGSHPFYTLSGEPPEPFENISVLSRTELFARTFGGTGVVCCDDIRSDPDYGKSAQLLGMRGGRVPLRSYLAVAVKSRSGEVLGGLFFGHPQAGVFSGRAERMAVAIASHAAIAIDNAHLVDRLQQEIGRREEVEGALRENERRFREMVDALPAAIYTTDAEGRLTHFNPAAVKLSGRTPELGTDKWCVAWKLFLADGTPLPHEECPMAIALKEGRIISGAECIAERPDGTRFWFTPYPQPLRDSGGRIVGGINMLVDITERKASEEAVRQSEARFRAIFDTTPECVKVVAPDGILLHMNSSGLSMIGASSTEEVVGRSIYDLIAPEFRDAFREFNGRVCRGEKSSLQFDVVGLQGQRRQMESHAAPLRNPNGTTVQLAVTRDVTERMRRERAALLLGAIVDSSDDAIISKDLNGVITSWNPAAERLFGYTAGEAVGKPVTILIPEDRLDEEPNILGRIRRGERVDHFETIRRRKDGKLLNISLTISPVKNSEGKIIGASKIARDVTERKRAEESIRALNEHLTADLSAMTRMQLLSTRLVQAGNFQDLLEEILYVGIEIMGADMGNIQLLEDGALAIAAQRGFRPPFLEFFRTVQNGDAACGMALKSRERVVVENVSDSPVFAGSPAREVLLKAGALAVQSTPLVSRSGRILGIFSTHYRTPRQPSPRELRLLDVLSRQAADLIERRRAETELLSSEARFRQLADSMPQMVWTARPDGYIDYYNERWYEFTGFERGEFGDSSWEAILHPQDAKQCREAWHKSLQTGEPFRNENRFWDRRQSRWCWFMSRALAVRDDAGKIVKWFGTSTDIDEQKRVEDQLRRANEDLEQFAYSASHDLQEPLRGIKIYSELLTQRYKSNLSGEGVEFLRYLAESATRMEMLVRDILTYTQVAKQESSHEQTDAEETLAQTLANLKGAIEESGAVVESDPLPSVRMHSTHLQQLFQNIIGNAIKYHSPDRPPRVHISASWQKDLWVFAVADNGIGIEPEYKERIFGLFKRLHTVAQYSGTGIGLAICQRIVERHHGRIWVESEPGAGSTFFFTLPG